MKLLTKSAPKSGAKSTRELKNANRAATRERVKRLRDRRKGGILVVTVELDEAALRYLAAGTRVDIGVLRRDRGQLADAVQRALLHGMWNWKSGVARDGRVSG